MLYDVIRAVSPLASLVPRPNPSDGLGLGLGLGARLPLAGLQELESFLNPHSGAVYVWILQARKKENWFGPATPC